MSQGRTGMARPLRRGILESGVADHACGSLVHHPMGLKGILRDGQRCRFTARELIYREGEPTRAVYIVRHGLVKLVSYSPGGSIRILRIHGRGAWMGLGGLLHPLNEHSAVAVKEVEVYRIPLKRLARLKEENLTLYCQLAETWHACLRSADFWITHFSSGPVRARVARLVNFLATLRDGSLASEVCLLTCEEMAAILGVTTESVSRTLADFKRSGVLSARRGLPDKRYERNDLALRSVAGIG